MRKTLPLVAALCSANAFADYQLELHLGAGHTEAETTFFLSDSNSARAWDTALTYYFAPVTLQGVPLSDAAFLGHASWVMASVNDVDRNKGGLDQRQKDVSVRWVLSGGTIIGVSYQDYDARRDIKYEKSEAGIKIGQYLSDSSSIELHYQKFEDDYDSTQDVYFTPATGNETFSLNYRNIVMADSVAQTDIQLKLIKAPVSMTLASEIGWYFDRDVKLGFTAGVTDQSFVGNPDSRELGVFGEWFINEKLAVDASYTMVRPDTRGAQRYPLAQDEIHLGLIYRL